METKQGVNIGREKAEQAAKAVGGKAIFPVFTNSENELTDFNDLATKSVFGKAGLERQVKTAVAMEIEKQFNHLGQSHERDQRNKQSQMQRPVVRI